MCTSPRRLRTWSARTATRSRSRWRSRSAGPRLGHVFVDLATVRDTAAVESDEPVDLSALPWPAVEGWLGALSGSELVAVGEEDAGGVVAGGVVAGGVVAGGEGKAGARPLRLLGTRLYLDRYWREERAVAADLNEMTASGRLQVIAGGPGTGKTTRVARIVAELIEEAVRPGPHPPTPPHRPNPPRPPLIALAAPTGKAAARLQEAVHEETAKLPVGESVRAILMALRASTLHRLLGWRPGSHSRFAHDRGNRLPHDVVIVDETSMVSLSMMARLVEAVRPDARLILVGDPGQLTSIEAGVVLGDIVGNESGSRPAAGIVVLDRVHRYGGAIAALADAIRDGDGDAAVSALSAAPGEVTWFPVDATESEAELTLGPGARGGGGERRVRRGPCRRRRGSARRARSLPAAVRPSPRSIRRQRLDLAADGVGGRRARGSRRRPARFRRPAAARDRERLRARPLQRRHRRDRARPRRASDGACSSAAASCSISARCGSGRSRPCTR